MQVTPAPFIRYPHSQNREDRFFRVDVDTIDPILLRQKDMIYEMYNHMTNTNLAIGVRQTIRQQAIDTLFLLNPLWKMFEYEYKYQELYRMFDEYTIV
jgi:hypothetical protein